MELDFDTGWHAQFQAPHVTQLQLPLHLAEQRLALEELGCELRIFCRERCKGLLRRPECRRNSNKLAA